MNKISDYNIERIDPSFPTQPFQYDDNICDQIDILLVSEGFLLLQEFLNVVLQIIDEFFRIQTFDKISKHIQFYYYFKPSAQWTPTNRNNSKTSWHVYNNADILVMDEDDRKILKDFVEILKMKKMKMKFNFSGKVVWYDENSPCYGLVGVLVNDVSETIYYRSVAYNNVACNREKALHPFLLSIPILIRPPEKYPCMILSSNALVKNVGTLAHEIGHIFGLEDEYVNGTNQFNDTKDYNAPNIVGKNFVVTTPGITINVNNIKWKDLIPTPVRNFVQNYNNQYVLDSGKKPTQNIKPVLVEGGCALFDRGVFRSNWEECTMSFDVGHPVDFCEVCNKAITRYWNLTFCYKLTGLGEPHYKDFYSNTILPLLGNSFGSKHFYEQSLWSVAARVAIILIQHNLYPLFLISEDFNHVCVACNEKIIDPGFFALFKQIDGKFLYYDRVLTEQKVIENSVLEKGFMGSFSEMANLCYDYNPIPTTDFARYVDFSHWDYNVVNDLRSYFCFLKWETIIQDFSGTVDPPVNTNGEVITDGKQILDAITQEFKDFKDGKIKFN